MKMLGRFCFFLVVFGIGNLSAEPGDLVVKPRNFDWPSTVKIGQQEIDTCTFAGVVFYPYVENPKGLGEKDPAFKELPIRWAPKGHEKSKGTGELSPRLLRYRKAIEESGVHLSDGECYGFVYRGKISSFANADSVLRRLLPNGDPDPSFTSGVEEGASRGRRARFFRRGIGLQGVKCLSLLPSQQLLVAGLLEIPDEDARPSMLRLNHDGSIDASFGLSAQERRGGDLAPITSISLQTDGKMIVAGPFGWLAGERCPGLARLLPDGSFDEDFNPPRRLKKEFHSLEADGQILLGNFSWRSSVEKASLIWLENGPGKDVLERKRKDEIRWYRSGALPEFHSAFVEEFEGGEWRYHSDLQRIDGGWKNTKAIEAEKVRAIGVAYFGVGRVRSYIKEL